MMWLPDSEKKCEDMFIRFVRIHECDRHTHTQTDRHRMTAKTALAYHHAAMKQFQRSFMKLDNVFAKQKFHKHYDVQNTHGYRFNGFQALVGFQRLFKL